MVLTALVSVLYGMVQGLTEFLPVSSSGHLVLLHRFLPLAVHDELAFDVALHLGTLAALLVYFWRDLRAYGIACGAAIVHRTDPTGLARQAGYLILGTLPVLLIGGIGAGVIEERFRHVESVVIMLIFFGVLLLFADHTGSQKLSINQLNWKSTLIIGCAQVLALVPGVSRSGITIIAGLAEGLKREAAARWSFLLAIPAVLAAGAKKTVDLVQAGGIVPDDRLLFVLGFVSSAVVGFAAVAFLLRFVQQRKLAVFGYYRIALGVVLYLVL